MKNTLKLINITLFFFASSFLGDLSQAQAGDVLITTEPSIAEVAPGESFSVEIKVNPNSVVVAPNGVAGIQMNFEFDKDLVQVDSVILSGEVDGSFSSAGSIDNDQGVVSSLYGMPVDYPTLFPDAEFTFATVNLTASSSLAGTAYLRLPYLADCTDPLNSLIICDNTLYPDGPLPLQYDTSNLSSSIVITDSFLPSDITDLSAGSPTASSITLTWTAPGDDGITGTASSYDIRYSTSEITEDNWSGTTPVGSPPAPQIAGTSESKTVTGLSSSTTYYFAIKTSDEVPNTSGLSNIASVATSSICTSFTYSDWTACQPNNTQTRTVLTSSPENCSDGSPVLSQSCTYNNGGGGGGGGTPTDTTPPGKITNFTASAGDQEVILTWKNPSDSDFKGTKILRKEGGYPANTSDGKMVYNGKEETYTDTELTNDIVYYYAVFTYDGRPNYSQAVTATATPEEGKIHEPPEPSSPDYPDDTLLKTPDDEKIYIIKENKKKWIETAEEFAAGGYRWEDIKTISADELAAIPDYSSGGTPPAYPNDTLLKIPESFKIYVMIDQKKKWISTPEVFETLGYQWGSITILNKTELNSIPNYEDNLIRAIGNYKVYLVVSGISRHIPNPEIFLNYGFVWEDVVDVPQSTIDKYQRAYLIRESKQGTIYYLRADGVKKWIRNPEIFTSYNNKWEDIQVISKPEMDSYPESNLIQLHGDDKVYLLEGSTKRWIPNAEIFNKHQLNWGLIMTVNEVEFNYFARGKNVR